MSGSAACQPDTQARQTAEQRLLQQETLELRVRERTAVLEAANQRLVAELAEHRRSQPQPNDAQGDDEQAARPSAADRMAAVLALELDRSLTATVGSLGAVLRMLANENADMPAAQEVLDRAVEQLSRAIRIVPGLRDLSRPSETRAPLQDFASTGDGARALDVTGRPPGHEARLAAPEVHLARHAGLDRAHASADAVRRMAALSTRERQVLDGLVAGRPNKAIAADLGISVRTVEVHRARMLRRLGTRQLADAIRLAVIASLRS